jgi:Bifunctional DNA primase/polymerase, N-terminal
MPPPGGGRAVPERSGRDYGAAPTPVTSNSDRHTNPTDDGADLDLADWAVRYARAGLRVLSLHGFRDGRCSCRKDCGRNAGKHPITCHGVDDASTDLRQVTAWWRRWPWANVGIRIPAGLVVLDVDPRNGGAVALAELTRVHGPLSPTLTARTGGGGSHIWLAYAGSARGQLCRGVDVKTETGYVVAPPSVHLSGRRYEWLDELPTASAPRWVRRILDPSPPLPSRPPVAGGSIDRLVAFVAEAPDGELNNRLYWASCRAAEAGLDTGPLVEAAVAKGHPQAGAERTARSAGKAPPRKATAALR